MTLVRRWGSITKSFYLSSLSHRAVLLAASLAASTPAIGLAQSAPSGPAAPQPGTKIYGLQDVVITARHRSERAQSVPIPITTIETSQIRNLGSNNINQIKQLVPSLTVNSANARTTGYDIRGLGSTGFIGYDGLEGGVGVYVDGVLLGRPTAANFDFPDLQDIEVLRGPQGTLFGKNTVNGAVDIRTRLPSFTPEADFSASYGNYNYWQFQGYATSALGNSDKAAISLSAHAEQNGGFERDTLTGLRYGNVDDKGVRTQLLLLPNSALTIRIIANYDHQDGNCCSFTQAGIVTNYANGAPASPNILTQYKNLGYTLPAINPFGRTEDFDSYTHYAMETGSLSAQADYDLDGFTLTSITAGSYYNWYPHQDGDTSGLPIVTKADSTTFQRQFSQELRVTSPLGGAVDFTSGLYFFYQQLNDQVLDTFGADAAGILLINGKSNPGYSLTNAALNGFSSAATDIPETYSGAAYGQATWHITPQLDLTGGARFTYEDKTGDFYQVQEGGAPVAGLGALGPVVQTIRNSLDTPTSYQVQHSDMLPGGLITLSYKPEPDILTYATYSHGEKSAGLNLVSSAVVPKIVAPEKLDNYEIGAKTTLLNDHLLLNGDVFWDEDTDYQSTIVGALGGGEPISYLASVPKVRSRGAEADIHALVGENLHLFASGIYDEAYYESDPSGPCPYELSNVDKTCNLTGRPLAGASKWAASLGGEYDYPLPNIDGKDSVAYVGGNILLRTGFYSTGDDSKYSLVPGYGVGNITFGIRQANGAWDISGWIHNVTNQNYYILREVVGAYPVDNLVVAEIGDPITFGVTLRAKFR